MHPPYLLGKEKQGELAEAPRPQSANADLLQCRSKSNKSRRGEGDKGVKLRPAGGGSQLEGEASWAPQPS
jgi:hypothetical protein